MVSPQGLVLLMAVLPVLDSSLVQLKNNGYEGILIAINPNIPEDNNIIENIKAMLTNASIYLFNSTRRRAFIRTVNILVPITWSAKSSYSRARTESYETADVIVADPFGKYGNDPYTLQYGGCGDPGRYIHFTPKFLLDDTLLKAYGPRGRVFVHEWSHLRWGVFDEYNLERPFYITVDKQVEATRNKCLDRHFVMSGSQELESFCSSRSELQLCQKKRLGRESEA